MGVEVDVAEFSGILAPFFGEAEDEVVGSFVVVYLGEDLAADEACELVVELSGGHSVGEKALVIGFNTQLGNGGLGLGARLFQARDPTGDLGDLVPEVAESVEIRSVDLDGDLC